MTWAMLPVLIGADPAYVESFASREQAAKVLAREVQTGTLFFSQGDCLAIRIFSKSRYTHVGVVIIRKGKPYVYHACKTNGVCCQPLKDYLRFLQKDALHVYHPRKSISGNSQATMLKFLRSKIGTPYAVKHHLTGKRSSKGMHCAEYMTDALMAIDMIHANRPAKVSPGSLAKGLVIGELYRAAKTVNIAQPPPERSDNRAKQLWIDTKKCSGACWRKVKGWFCCS